MIYRLYIFYHYRSAKNNKYFFFCSSLLFRTKILNRKFEKYTLYKGNVIEFDNTHTMDRKTASNKLIETLGILFDIRYKSIPLLLASFLITNKFFLNQVLQKDHIYQTIVYFLFLYIYKKANIF